MRRTIGTLLVLLLTFDSFALEVSDRAEGRTYFIKSDVGDDSSDGLSEGTAWKTFKRVNSHTFLPGDKLLLTRGSHWVEKFAPKGSGTALAPILISATGQGPDPEITQPANEDAAIELIDQEHWVIEGLSIYGSSQQTQERSSGIVVVARDANSPLHGITVRRCTIIGTRGFIGKYENAGIWIGTAGWGTRRNARTVIHDVLIEDNVVINAKRCGIVFWNTSSPSHSRYFNNDGVLARHVTVRRNVVVQSAGDGILVMGVMGADISFNTVVNAASESGRSDSTERPYNTQAAGLWIHSGQASNIYGNLVAGTQKHILNKDGMAYDLDLDSTANRLFGNRSIGNEGGFLLVMESARENLVYCNASANDGENSVRRNDSLGNGNLIGRLVLKSTNDILSSFDFNSLQTAFPFADGRTRDDLGLCFHR